MEVYPELHTQALPFHIELPIEAHWSTRTAEQEELDRKVPVGQKQPEFIW
jgi:hypothetical protein